MMQSIRMTLLSCMPSSVHGVAIRFDRRAKECEPNYISTIITVRLEGEFPEKD